MKHIGKTIGLVTWQTSLIISSVGFLVFSGVLVISSPQTRENIQGYAVDVAKATLSDVATITFEEDMTDTYIFVYNKLSESKKPMDLTFDNQDTKTSFELYPGSYRMIVIKEGYERIEKDIIIKVGEKAISIDLDLIPLPVETEEEQSDEDPKVILPASIPIQISDEPQQQPAQVPVQTPTPTPVPTIISRPNPTPTIISTIPNDSYSSYYKSGVDISVEEIIFRDKFTGQEIDKVQPGQSIYIIPLLSDHGSSNSGIFSYKLSVKVGSQWEIIDIGNHKGLNAYEQNNDKLLLSWTAPSEPTTNEYEFLFEANINNQVLETSKYNNLEHGYIGSSY